MNIYIYMMPLPWFEWWWQVCFLYIICWFGIVDVPSNGSHVRARPSAPSALGDVPQGKSPNAEGLELDVPFENGYNLEVMMDSDCVPVVPHKAVAEVSEDTYRRVWLLWITDGRANPLIDRKVGGVVFFGVVALVAVVTSLTCSCGCSVVES